MTSTVIPRSASRRLVCPLDCPDTCGMQVEVQEGRAVKLRGDRDHCFTRGFLCGKMAHFLEDRVYSADRLREPLQRVGPKGSGQFEPMSWDQALDRIATRFAELADSPEGPQTILPYSYAGTMGLVQAEVVDRRFFHRLGASRLDRTICSTAGELAYTLTCGSGKLGADPMGVPECSLIINWGSNTSQTNSHLWSLMVQARKQHGAQIVTIDPHLSATARRSDLHLPIRPGTDAALALGLMHLLCREGWLDQDYLDNYTLGWPELRLRVTEEYPPERVAQITGLGIDLIENFAQLYGTIRPSLIRLNYGMQRHGGGGMATRTVACLPALVGAWRDWGGGALLSTSGAYDYDIRSLQRHDLLPDNTRTINMNQLAEALQGELPGPPVRAIYVYNANPATVAPDLQRVEAGLKRDDLFTVVHEQFLTDTARLADIVLPATTQAEHWDLHTSYGHHLVMLNQPAIAPLTSARSNARVFTELAHRLGFEPELFPSEEEVIGQILDSAGPRAQGVTFERLLEEGWVRLNLAERYLPFARGGFPTPSGKCELRCDRMIELGWDPLPTYTPPHEDPQTQPERASRFPLQLLSPPRGSFLNSTFANSSRHRKIAGEPTVELHPDDADSRRLHEGQHVRVYNDRGDFWARLVIGQSVQPGVAVAQGLYWRSLGQGGNANTTTSTRLADLGGGATFFDNLVEVEAFACSQTSDD